MDNFYAKYPVTGGVTSLDGMTGAISLVAGTNITIVDGPGTITINATGGGGGGANQSLSNLTNPTAINQDLIFDEGATAHVKTKDDTLTTESLFLSSGDTTVVDGTSGGIQLFTGVATGVGGSGRVDMFTGTVVDGNSGASAYETGAATGIGNSGDIGISTGSSNGGGSGQINFATGSAGGAPTGPISIHSGNPGNANLDSGTVLVFTGTVTGTGRSGDLTLKTGDATGTSGDVLIQSGTGTTRGHISLANGTEGTAGYVWTSTNTTGAGAWQPPTGGSGSRVVELRTLSGPEAAAKQITLVTTPPTANYTVLDIQGAPGQFYGADFTVTGNILSWSGLGLDGILSTGDNLTIITS